MRRAEDEKTLRPSAYRGSGQEDRERHYAECGGEKDTREAYTSSKRIWRCLG
jgi:hypothetical protein